MPTKKVTEEAPAVEELIEIQRLGRATILVPIVGTAPLIMSRFSQKAKAEMLNIAQGKKSQKEPKDPIREYQDALYHFKDGYGFPSLAFKAATVSAARYYKRVAMTELRQYLFFAGQVGPDGVRMVSIEGEPRMREDTVRYKTGGTDLRYRPEFPEWKATLEIVFVTSALTQGSVMSLVEAGGLGVGVGEWRPERKGDFGTYEIDKLKEVEILS